MRINPHWEQGSTLELTLMGCWMVYRIIFHRVRGRFTRPTIITWLLVSLFLSLVVRLSPLHVLVVSLLVTHVVGEVRSLVSLVTPGIVSDNYDYQKQSMEVK